MLTNIFQRKESKMLTNSQKAIRIMNIIRDRVQGERSKSISAHADYAKAVEGHRREMNDREDFGPGPGFGSHYDPDREIKYVTEADERLEEAEEVEQFAIETFLGMIDREDVMQSNYKPYIRHLEAKEE
jgi:hypothetical protein